MRIHILFSFKDSPSGGGNQFLKAMRDSLRNFGVYEERAENADVILFNSHHELKKVFWLKKKFPEKVFVHRLDGPIQLYRGKDKSIDNLIFKINKLLADGVIFQSNWSREQNRKIHQNFPKYQTVIYNAPDLSIFNKIAKKEFSAFRKIKLVAVSWSNNLKKGFDVYKYLDEHLDFKKYEMVFIGNSPVDFKNIKTIKPVGSKELAVILKQNDIYITSSQKDPCSNALIEALSCGLPAVGLNDGGHPELIKKGGELFWGTGDIISKIEKVANNYLYYQNKLSEFSLKKASEQYFYFCLKIFEDAKNGYYFPRQVGVVSKISFYFSVIGNLLDRASKRFFKKV
ncbi:MAG: glycosyltransferase family 4 protein [Candidatus Pacebacteria bacterium]|nr:glycosyltransferase family 4 protein [Candidatus Paceibacterota bacterium]